MDRLYNNQTTVVINWTDNDVTDAIKDETATVSEKENQVPVAPSQTQAAIKRRKSVKVKVPNNDQQQQQQQNQETYLSNDQKLNLDPTNTVGSQSISKETNHFDFATSTHSKTSNNKLKQSHRITYAEMIDILNKYKYKHDQYIDNLNSSYEHYFDKWFTQMKFGFNILVYGVGSKKNLIERFIDLFLKPYHYLILLGYHPDVNPKNIFKTILTNVLEIYDTFKTFDEQIQAIKKHLNFPLYIIIHNIDGNCLRDSEIQYRLAELAGLEYVHIIASVDHINSALLWDNVQYTQFKWIYYDMSTFKAYNDEIMFENSLMLNQTGNVQLSSLIHVLKSLTQNAKNIFLIMVEYVLNEENVKKNIPFTKLYYECREKFYVSNELTLRAQLTEFIDHKLIKIKTENDGTEAIYLLIDDTNLKLYIDELKDKI